MNGKTEENSPVITIRNAAATANITVTKLRGKVSVLEGSGGNIAVVTGRDGNLLVDASIPGTKVWITEALASLSNDPVKSFDQYALALRSHRRERMVALDRRGNHRALK
jgi:hypothetical protein